MRVFIQTITTWSECMQTTAPPDTPSDFQLWSCTDIIMQCVWINELVANNFEARWLIEASSCEHQVYRRRYEVGLLTRTDKMIKALTCIDVHKPSLYWLQKHAWVDGWLLLQSVCLLLPWPDARGGRDARAKSSHTCSTAVWALISGL